MRRQNQLVSNAYRLFFFVNTNRSIFLYEAFKYPLSIIETVINIEPIIKIAHWRRRLRNHRHRSLQSLQKSPVTQMGSAP